MDTERNRLIEALIMVVVGAGIGTIIGLCLLVIFGF